jgi:hypothetical protein
MYDVNQLVLTVGPKDADLIGTTSETIQAAIDRVGALGGGIVNLLPGTYIMNDSVHLRSNITLRGQGDETVLWKPASISSPVIHANGYGLYAVCVAEPEKFPVGSGVYITDDHSVGFYDTVATISWKRGNELGLTRSLHHDITEAANGRVISVYPLISGYDLEHAAVENLVIDGNAKQNEFLNGCRGGGIFLLRAHHVQIRNVTVKHYNGEGISFQQCTDTLVEYCSCIDNTGNGLHPGSGSVGFVFRGTTCSRNGNNGIFYCLRVSYSHCEDCVIEDNENDGLSIGHRDTDAVIRRNRIASNGRHGIYIRKDSYNMSGHRTVVEDNVFHTNCRRDGESDILIASAVEDMHLIRNSFQADEAANYTKTAVFFDAPSKRIVFYGNETLSCTSVQAAQPSYMDGISFEEPTSTFEVGANHTPSDAAKHLQVALCR